MNRITGAALAAVLTMGCGGAPEEEAEIEPRVPVGLATIVSDTITEAVKVVGRLAPTPGGSAQLTAPAAGIVSAVPVQVGTRVTAGQLLVDLTIPDLAQNARALGATADAAERDARRQQELLKQGITSQRQAEQRQADAVAARAQADAASQLASRARVRSPITGLVQRVLVHPGERVEAGAVLAEVIDGRVLDLIAEVPAADLARLKPKQAAAVTVEGLAESRSGRVEAIAPAVDSLTNAAQVVIRIPNPGGILHAGTGATALVTVGRRSDAIVVPDSALVVVGDSLTIFVVEGDSIAHAQSVTVGARRNGRAEILAGLTPGQRIVVSGAFGLADGMRVVPAEKVVPAEAAKP